MKEIEKAQMGIITVLALMLVSIKRRLPTRRFSSGITTLALAGIVLLVVAGSASAATITSCGVVPSGSHVLGANLTANADEACLLITADNVVIDGYNATDGICYTITGAVTSSDCTQGCYAGLSTGESTPANHSGVVSNRNSNVVLKNLTIEKFCTGIALFEVQHGTTSCCNIYDNGIPYGTANTAATNGIHLSGVGPYNITKNEIHNNTGDICGCSGGGNGIFTYGGSGGGKGDYNSYTCNNLYDNDKSGFFSKKACKNNIISYNNVTENRAGGIVLRCANTHNTTVEYNNVSNNLGTGIYFRANNNTLRYNTVINNQNGSTWAGICSYPTASICDAGVGVEVEDTGTNAKIYNNTICNNVHVDVDDNSNGGGGGFLVGDYNTGGSVDGYNGDASAGGSNFVYTCTNLVSVYYDYDGDSHFSNTTANCSCNCCAVGVCCNPGLFSDTGKVQHCANNLCKYDGPGTDPNDCNDSIKGPENPDLIVESITVPMPWHDLGAKQYNISYTVRNQGTDNVTDDNWVNITIDGVVVMNVSTSHLTKGIGETKEVGPFTMSDSSDTIVICADWNKTVDELDEDNNCKPYTVNYPAVGIKVGDPYPSGPSDCVKGIFCVDINVSPNGIPVYGVQYKLTYNPSVIYVLSQDEGTFLSHNGNNTAETRNYLDTVNGYSEYGLTRIGSLLGETTPGTLVKVKYKTIGSPEATSWINLSEVVVSDTNADGLDSTLENGSVAICPANQPPDANCSVDHKYNNAGYGMTTFNGTESTDDANLLNHFFTWQTHTHTGNLLGMVVDDFYDVSCYNGTCYDPFGEYLYLMDEGGLMDTCTCDVIVYIAGDANGDCKVNILDASMTGLRWNKVCDNYGGVCWGMMLPTPDSGADMADRADLNNDCVVNILDTSIVGLNWGDACQGGC